VIELLLLVAAIFGDSPLKVGEVGALLVLELVFSNVDTNFLTEFFGIAFIFSDF